MSEVVRGAAPVHEADAAQLFPEADAEPVFRWSDYRWEDWVAFVVFWALAATVFLQFFTRYVLNDSFAWTEEGARYLLIATTFLGAALAVRRRSHIVVEFLYNYLPRRSGLILSAVAEIITIGFLGVAVWVTGQMIPIMHNQQMAVIELPMSLLYGVVLVGLLMMLIRTLQLTWAKLRA